MKYSGLEKLLVLELYDKTGNIDYIKNKTGISKKTISTWIKNSGCSEVISNHTEKFITAKKIFDDVYDGYSLKAIMGKRNLARLEVSNLMDYYIRSCFDKLEVNKREIQVIKTKIETEDMINAIAEGRTSISKIAEENKVTISAISKRISRYEEKWGKYNE